MKKKLAVAFALLSILAVTVPSRADRYQRSHADNPARIVGYVLNPVGLIAEYAVMRPIHWVVSQPNLDIVFGHKPAVEQDGTYFEWVHGDFSPSIAQEREDRERAVAPVVRTVEVKRAPESKSMVKPAAAPADMKMEKKAEKRAEKKMEKRMDKQEAAPKGADTSAGPACCSETKS